MGAVSLIIACTPLANLLAMPLLRIPSAPAPADIVVVLSGGRYDDGSLNDVAIERTIAGVRLYYQGFASRLLFTGGPCCGQSASALMATLATELGVPRSVILLEEESIHTRDSAVNCAALLRKSGWQSAILVTSPLHMLRTKLAFAAVGVPVHPVLASKRKLLLGTSASDRISLLHDALHEYLGLAYYRLRGWL